MTRLHVDIIVILLRVVLPDSVSTIGFLSTTTVGEFSLPVARYGSSWRKKVQRSTKKEMIGLSKNPRYSVSVLLLMVMSLIHSFVTGQDTGFGCYSTYTAPKIDLVSFVNTTRRVCNKRLSIGNYLSHVSHYFFLLFAWHETDLPDVGRACTCTEDYCSESLCTGAGGIWTDGYVQSKQWLQKETFACVIDAILQRIKRVSFLVHLFIRIVEQSPQFPIVDCHMNFRCLSCQCGDEESGPTAAPREPGTGCYGMADNPFGCTCTDAACLSPDACSVLYGGFWSKECLSCRCEDLLDDDLEDDLSMSLSMSFSFSMSMPSRRMRARD